MFLEVCFALCPYDSNRKLGINNRYVAGASGPKDVVLIIDTSGSMASLQRMELAKSASIAVLKTLSFVDYVSVVTFATLAKNYGGSSNKFMVPANSSNLALIQTFIEGLYPSGGTHFDGAFELAFDILANSFAHSKSSNCHTVLLFLTDGQNFGEDPLPRIQTFLAKVIPFAPFTLLLFDPLLTSTDFHPPTRLHSLVLSFQRKIAFNEAKKHQDLYLLSGRLGGR